MKKRQLLALAAFTALAFNAFGQAENSFVHEQSDANGYVWPTDTEVLAKLDKWQDQKFGVLMHWGLYSKPGICESWPLCSEDWVTRPGDCNYEEYKKWYWGMIDELNPVDFNPEQWAEVMADAGMKYMIFTTKHHDGFCTFDSKYTDFSIAKGAFKDNPRSNVALHVFNAFRDKGFMMGCYFSKPDWHYEYFWHPGFATANRHVNYNVKQHPDWWQKYVDYTNNQLDELMTDYGHFDILWLDGGWITGEQIGLDNILARARKNHPGLIAVDRAVRGHNENYQTPERGVPETQLNYPWESCIPLGDAWGWVARDRFKSPGKVVGLLSEIVAKGGCFVLGVGPTPEGIIQADVVERLKAIGAWLRVNGQAIYNTRTTPNYNDGKVWFTANKDGETLYAIYATEDNETLPATIEWTGNVPEGKVTLLAGNKTLKYKKDGEKVTVTLPKGLKNEPIALSFKVKKQS